MNEENGDAGGKTYFKMHSANLARHIAAIESDNGAGRPLGVAAHVPAAAMSLLKPLMTALLPLGAGVLEHRDGSGGSDIDLLDEAGVPTLAPIVDARTYFDYHHSAADTLDKVDPDNFRRQVAVLAMMAYFLADMPEPLPRPSVP
jgi:carboxypeptidase Q